jgi:nitroreductase
MDHLAPTDRPVQELLRRRWSPYAFDPDRDVAEDDLRALFEAARWTMSSFNAQPWRYIVGVRQRQRDVWSQVLSTLVESNQAWAQHVPVLCIGLTRPNFEHNEKPNRAAVHDLGAASANLTFEATARGLMVHQMAGIQPDKVRAVFDIPPELEPVTGIAIGYLGDARHLDEKYAMRDQRPRVRKTIDEFVIRGGF